MIMQQIETKGLSLSPILADFQNTLMNPVLYRSMSLGQCVRMYAHAQIRSKSAATNACKLNIAPFFVMMMFVYISMNVVLP